jgi:ABC-2 type transport system permease protein
MNVITLISVGLLMLSVFRKLSAVNVAANILYQLMMFLGGLFFDVSHTPMIIRWFVYINPVSYMAQGLRNIINGMPLGFLNYFVPLLWIGACIIIFSLNFKKVMNYE